MRPMVESTGSGVEACAAEWHLMRVLENPTAVVLCAGARHISQRNLQAGKNGTDVDDYKDTQLANHYARGRVPSSFSVHVVA